jgi:hypothetical protein
MALAGALVGCDRPELEPFERAVSAYDDGRAALEGGRAEDAVTAFGRARAADPASVELAMWEARALAAAGRHDDADARLAEVLQRDPSLAVAWYNRGAYRARAGDANVAATYLREALARGASSAFEAAVDPDFAPLRAHPAFSDMLPAAPVVLDTRGPEGSVFLGSRLDVALRASSLPGAPLQLRRAGADPGCVRLVRVIEDTVEAPGLLTRTITLTFEATGPCDAALGPFEAVSGDSAVTGAPVALRVEAPPGTAPASSRLPVEIPLPGALVAPDRSLSAVRVGTGFAALSAEGVGRTDGHAPHVALELRSSGETRVTGGYWEHFPDAAADVRLRSGAAELPVP